MSAGVAIPANVRRMIQDIKEIAGNHGDEEVYAVLKECSMDPNETAQRLLFQDTFHEVKRKRDKRKESNKEPTDSRWTPVVEGRGGRGGRANYSTRHVANDAGGGKSVNAGRENGAEKVYAKTPSPLVHNAEIKSRIPMQSSFGTHANGPLNVRSSFSSHGSSSQVPYINCMAKAEEIVTTNSNKKGANINSKISSVSNQPVLVSAQLQPSMTPSYDSEVFVSSSDPEGPVLVPNLDVGAPDVVGRTESGGGSQSAVDKTVKKVVSHDFADSESSSIGSKGPPEIGNNYMDGKLQIKSPQNEMKQPLDIPLPMPSSSLAPSISSRPSSNYSNRSQQLSSLHKAGPNKEWKPKTSHVNTAHSSAIPATSEILAVTVEVVGHSVPALSSTASEDDAPNLQKRLERLHFADTGGVIIPDHLQVPDSNKYSLRFGSFDANYEPGASFLNGSNSDRCSTPLSELTQEIDENIEQPPSSQIAPPTVEEAAYPDDFQSSGLTLENLASRESDVSSAGSILQEYDQSKPEPTLVAEVPQHSIVQTTPTYPTLNLTPQMLGGQFTGFEGTENHLHDDPHLTSFASGNSLVPSSTGPSLVVSQATGAVQSAIPVNLQPVPLFRQPAGIHIAHYHPNYVPYNQYLSPIFVQPAAAIHPFLSSTTFPQQTPAGGMFTPAAAAASPNSVKYTMPQYKPGNNTVNSAHSGVLTGYGTYNSTPAGYNPNPSGTGGNSNINEDLTASSQFKENNVYMTGQQSDGSAVWVATPGHDISVLQASSFYNLPPHQHITFAPSQAGHGAFPGIYHPTQAVTPTIHPLLPQSQPTAGAIEMVGPPAGVYQQPQRTQINWANNY